MRIFVFSKEHPQGVLKDDSLVSPEIMRAVETSGVYRGPCWCCDKPIVVRLAGERAVMSAGDEHFLLHQGANDG